MKREYLYGIIGLLLGIVIAWSAAAYAVNSEHEGMMRAMGIRGNQQNMNMDDNDGTGTCSLTQCSE
jgi:hypothetical protein